MTAIDAALENLAPDEGWSDDWEAVLARAGETQARPKRVRRRPVVALAALAAILTPLVALAAAKGWWFSSHAPVPTSAPLVVKTGTWGGRGWQLVAYPSSTDGLCFSITPQGSNASGRGAAMDCAPLSGIPRTSETKSAPDLPIVYLVGDSRELPSYIAGAVIESANSVVVKFDDGTSLTTPTFTGPAPLDHVRFYATPLPSSTQQGAAPAIEWVAGRDGTDHVIACLAPGIESDGISPLSACH